MRRAIGVVAAIVVLTAALAGCAGGKHSAVGTHSSIHQRQAQEAARAARLRAEREARLRAKAAAERSRPVPTPPILRPGTAHPTAATIALRYLGVPYVWGGANPRGFDTSGLVTYVYAQLGVSLPHYTVSQWNATAPISRSKMKPGDLVFFNGLEQVGIYIGGGQYIDAPHTGAVVRIESLEARSSSFDGARRVM